MVSIRRCSEAVFLDERSLCLDATVSYLPIQHGRCACPLPISALHGLYAGSKSQRARRHHACVLRENPRDYGYHNVYGPRMGFEMSFRSANAYCPGRIRRCLSVDHIRDCYITDAVSATIAAMESDVADGQTINIGTDEEVTIGDLTARVLRATNVTAEIAAQSAGYDPIKRRCPDISRARRLLGYRPQVSLSEGLERTLAWYEPRLLTSRDQFITARVESWE